MENTRGSKNGIDWKRYLKSGDRIFIGSNAAVPNALVDQLIDEQAPPDLVDCPDNESHGDAASAPPSPAPSEHSSASSDGEE